MRDSIATNFLFAHQTDLLADEERAAAMSNDGKDFLKGIYINQHFPWIPDFLESLPLSISKPIMPPGLIDLLNLFDVGNPFAYKRWNISDRYAEGSC